MIFCLSFIIFKLWKLYFVQRKMKKTTSYWSSPIISTVFTFLSIWCKSWYFSAWFFPLIHTFLLHLLPCIWRLLFTALRLLFKKKTSWKELAFFCAFYGRILFMTLSHPRFSWHSHLKKVALGDDLNPFLYFFHFCLTSFSFLSDLLEMMNLTHQLVLIFPSKGRLKL